MRVAENQLTSGVIVGTREFFNPDHAKNARKAAKLLREHGEEIDGLIVILPNFGDEIGVVETISRAGLDVPVLVQACRDEVDKGDVNGRRDSFSRKISVCNNLVQYGIPFTDTTSHTVDLDSEEFSPRRSTAIWAGISACTSCRRRN